MAIGAIPINGDAEDRVAVIIGGSAYELVTYLANPRKDASDIADALETLGYQVFRQFDLNFVEMIPLCERPGAEAEEPNRQ